MSYTPMDLDSSLDELIKKRRTKQQPKPTPNKKTPMKQVKKKPQQQQQKQQVRPNIQIQSSKAKITKPNAPQRSGINARLSTSKASGPLFTAKHTKEPSKADPSQIIITKAISNQPKRPEVKSVLTGRLGTRPSPKQISPEPMRMDTYIRPVEERSTDFSIRGRSNMANARPQLSIKGESGPTTVLVTGLDPGANSEDVKIALEDFGNILHCEVLRDRAGRSFGEAEVEFSTKGAALDCIARLDNQMADGKFLRIILREPKPKQSYAAKQIRSIISPSYAPSGKMHADQMTSRYDITRQ